jgi:hypothetical protein
VTPSTRSTKFTQSLLDNCSLVYRHLLVKMKDRTFGKMTLVLIPILRFSVLDGKSQTLLQSPVGQAVILFSVYKKHNSVFLTVAGELYISLCSSSTVICREGIRRRIC